MLREFIGGAAWHRNNDQRSGSGSATGPLVKLSIYGWGLRLTGRLGPVAALVPVLEYRGEEVAQAQVVQRFGTGIRFRMRNGDGLIFWGSTPALATVLESLGVQVNRTPERIFGRLW